MKNDNQKNLTLRGKRYYNSLTGILRQLCSWAHMEQTKIQKASILKKIKQIIELKIKMSQSNVPAEPDNLGSAPRTLMTKAENQSSGCPLTFTYILWQINSSLSDKINTFKKKYSSSN